MFRLSLLIAPLMISSFSLAKTYEYPSKFELCQREARHEVALFAQDNSHMPEYELGKLLELEHISETEKIATYSLYHSSFKHSLYGETYSATFEVTFKVFEEICEVETPVFLGNF